MNNLFIKNIKEKHYNIIRYFVKKHITGNLGKVVEDDEKLTCYVSKRKCKKHKYVFSYEICCYGIGKENSKLAETYKLNKPIHYVFDGIEFDKKRVYIHGYDGCDVYIKNCKFSHVLFNTFSVGARNVTIENMNITDNLALVGNNTDIMIRAYAKLDIIDSNIGKKREKTSVSLMSENQLNIVNSKLAGAEVYCRCEKMTSNNNSLLIAKNEVNIIANDLNQASIISPTIIYNGDSFTGGNDPITLKKLLEPLKIKRLELVSLLKKIKAECEKTNSEKLERISESLNEQSVGKVLKKIK